MMYGPHMATAIDKQSLAFRPNLTGELHVGTAMILAATYLDSLKRGVEFHMKWDDRYERADRKKEEIERVTVRSVNRALCLLDIPSPSLVYRHTEREHRYWDIATMLVERRLAVEEEPGIVVFRGTLYVEDLVYGRLREFLACLTYPPYKGYSNLASMVDAWDYNIPTIIRGTDLIREANVERAVWELLCHAFKEDRPMRTFAHIPVIADKDGNTLHKSRSPADPYMFDNFAKQFNTPDERLTALIRTIANLPGTGVMGRKALVEYWNWKKVVHEVDGQRVEKVRIAPDGTRVGLDFFFEGGQF